MLAAFRVMARLKVLRGTAFDIFGRTAERRAERQAIADYEARLGEIVANLTATNHPDAVALAAVPLDIRGFGHVKEANRLLAQAKDAALAARFHASASATALAAE